MTGRGSFRALYIVTFSLLLIATAVGLAPLQEAVRHRFEEFHEELMTSLEEATGRPLSYGEIAPSVFRSLRIEEVTLFRDQERREVLAQAGELRIYFSLWSLITNPGLESVKEISLRDARVYLDQEGELFGSDEFAGPGPELESFGSFPEELTLSGTNVDLVLTRGSDVLSLRNLVTEVAFRRPTLVFDLRASAGYQLALTGETVEGEVILRGRIEEGFESGTGFVEFPVLAYSDWELRNQAFAIQYQDRVVAVRKVRNRDPLELSVDYDLDEERLVGRLLADGFVPSTVVTGEGSDEVVSALLTASVDADARVEYSLSGEEGSVTGTTAFRFPSNSANVRLVEGQVGGSLETYAGTLRIVDYQGGTLRGRVAKRAASESVEAALSFSRLQLADLPAITGDVTLFGVPAGWRLNADRLQVGSGELYATNLEFRQTAWGLETEALTHFSPEETQALRATGRLFTQEDGRIEVDATLRGVPLGEVARVAGGPGGSGSALDALVVDSVLSLGVVDGSLELDAPFVSLYDASAPEERYLYFSLVQGQEEITVERIAASLGSMALEGRIVIGDRRAGVVPVSLDLTHEEGRYTAEAEYRPGGSFLLAGDYDSEVRLQPRQGGGILFAGSILGAPVEALGPEARVTVEADGYFATLEDWRASLGRADVVNVSGPTGPLTLRARGDFGPTGGQLAPLVIDDGVETLAGSLGVEQSEADAGIAINGTLTSGNGAESLRLSGSLDAGGLGINLQGTGVGLRRLGIAGLRGQTNFAAEATGDPGNLAVRGTVDIPEGQLTGESFTASGRFTLAEERLRVQNVQFRRGENRFDVSLAEVELAEGSIVMDARLIRGIGAQGRTTDIAVRYQRRVDEPFSEISQVIDDPFSAEVSLDGIDVVGVPEREWLFNLRRTSSGATIRGAPGNALRGQISNDGAFRLVLTDPLPIRFQAAGTLAQGTIEATITRIAGELPVSPGLGEAEERPEGRFVPLRGDIEGSLRVVGPVNDPDLFGTLSAQDFEAEVPYVEGVVSAPRVFVLFQEKTIQADRFAAGRDDAGATVEATILLSRWNVDQYEVIINTTGEEGLPITQNFGPVAVDGEALGRLRIYATPSTTDVSGEITAEETSITLITEDVVEREPRKITTVDLTLVAGRRLEFLWPSREVPIVRAFARAGDRVRVVSASQDESFALDGTVSIRGGEIFYVNRNFYMRQGRIVFNEDEAGFDPILSARAELREVGPRGPVRIFLIAEENPLSQFAPRLESSPPLTDDEIVALLGGAILEEGSTDVANLGSAVAVTSDVVTQFGIMSQFERQVREALNVDLFSVRTQVFQNIVIGSLEQTEVPLDTTAPSLGTYLDNTTVFLGKYLGSDLFLELLIELRARDPLEQDVIAIGGMEVDPEIGLEFDTPFFLLQWSFFPRTPESLFVADNTFEFSWQFSY